MMHGRRAEREDGSTVVELLVAAGVSLLALGMVLDSAIPAMRALNDTAQEDHRRIELETAGDIVARTIRAARPDALRPAVSGDDRTLVLSLGAGRTARIALDVGDLTLHVQGDPTGALRLPGGLMVDGLDMERSAFALLDADGAPTDGTRPLAVVIVTLSKAEETVVRAVAPRLRTHLDGAGPW